MLGNSVVLCILDGWGDGNGDSHDAISSAHKPFWDSTITKCPRTSLSASGVSVGLPPGQAGNSEVGHISLGSGRVILQDLQRINAAMSTTHKNVHLLEFIQRIRDSGGVCHIAGLLSDGGVHSLQDHILSLAHVISTRLHAKVLIHAFLDGRDTPPYSAKKYITIFNERMRQHNAQIATVIGRYYAMDRDNRLERTKQAHDAMVFARGARYADAISAIESSYNAGVSDEFLLPAVIGDYRGIAPNDGILIANFRSDRILQILSMLLHSPPKVQNILGMVQYSGQVSIPCLFPPRDINNTLGEVIAQQGLSQLRIAETEKYAHVTFFFSGGKEEQFSGEDRIIISSPKVPTYDLCPEMSAFEVTDSLTEKIESEKYAFIVVNYANADMVGHTGNIEAARKAISVVDKCIGRVFASVKKTGAVLLVTADHGNAEKMFDPQRDMPFTAHTASTVPFVLCNSSTHTRLRSGALCDVAPTILELMNIAKPPEMTGRSLILPHTDN